MSFGATITITVNAVAKVLNRINQAGYGSEYSLLGALDQWNLKIRHSVDSPDVDGVTMLRHNMHLTHITFATALLPISKETVTWTIRAGKFDGVAQLAYDAKAMAVLLAASSGAMQDDLVIGLN